ncbi:hypothetical protein KIN20_010189 [Parelaphostrongylus tenuis]|uniref:Uncharacterized protein n=1 Tax=Parelaphostrongylus tenuis TaxID=148309 RepID=A0AAD5QL91_PARTN|nr:hypothetical protein KIN20_010189 [Parelaphostrongylus tenuis]
MSLLKSHVPENNTFANPGFTSSSKEMLKTTTSSRTFNVTGFSLPVPMVYSESPTAVQVAGISRSADAARGFVMRSVMQAVFDVLEQQGRAAGLPDFIITSILNQITVNITYAPLECKRVVVNPMVRVMTMNMVPTCVIFSNTVTAICNHNNMCMISGGRAPMILSVIPREHFSISGTLSTSNNIMANWSRQMWQGVVNRVLRALALGPLRSHFFSAVATVS